MLVQSMHYFFLSSAVNLQDSCREKQWDGWIDNQLIFYLVTVAVDTIFRLTLTLCLFFPGVYQFSDRTEQVHFSKQNMVAYQLEKREDNCSFSTA